MVLKGRKIDTNQLIGAELIANAYKAGLFGDQKKEEVIEEVTRLMKRSIEYAGVQVPEAVAAEGPEALKEYARNMQPKKVPKKLFYIFNI